MHTDAMAYIRRVIPDTTTMLCLQASYKIEWHVLLISPFSLQNWDLPFFALMYSKVLWLDFLYWKMPVLVPSDRLKMEDDLLCRQSFFFSSVRNLTELSFGLQTFEKIVKIERTLEANSDSVLCGEWFVLLHLTCINRNVKSIIKTIERALKAHLENYYSVNQWKPLELTNRHSSWNGVEHVDFRIKLESWVILSQILPWRGWSSTWDVSNLFL